MTKNQAQGRQALRKPYVKWETVKWEDWPSNEKLAKVMGVTGQVVHYWRKKLAPHTRKPRLDKEFLDTLDWSKGNWELAEETGISYQSIAGYRYFLDKGKASPLSRKKHRAYPGSEKWLTADWSLSDKELAAKYQRTRWAASLARRKYAPETVGR
jgi:hypothetical protein